MDLKNFVHLQLSKDAQQFLEILINLGYLNEKNQELLHQQLLHLRNNSSTLEIDEVRRCAADGRRIGALRRNFARPRHEKVGELRARKAVIFHISTQ